MARFFLRFRTPEGSSPDPIGMELIHLGRLHHTVGKVAKDLVKDNPAASEWTFEVEDEAGRKVLSGKLGDALAAPDPEA